MKKRNIIIALCGAVILSLLACLAGCSGTSPKDQYIEGLFHDQGYVFMENTSPTDQETVTYRLRARKDSLTAATLRLTLDTDEDMVANCTYYDLKMSKEKTDETGYFEYWVCTVPAQDASYSYHFLCENNVDKVYYISSQELLFEGEPVHRSTDWMTYVNFETPEWTQGAVWYSLMPDSYNNGDITNDKLFNGGSGITTSGNFNNVVQNVWGNTHFSANDWFGGDLLGVSEKNDYFQDLQIDSLQMNPIWYTNHNAGYGAYDLTMLDSAFGNSDTLRALIDTLHDNGIKISLDAVMQYYVSSGKITNAAGIFPIEITEEDDLYYTVVYDSNGNLVAGRWGNEIDFSSPQAREWLYSQPASLIQLYLTEYDVDCWRLDVGAMLRGQEEGNYDTAYAILSDIRDTVKSIDKDIGFISETITSGGVTVDNGVLDSYWNYDYANAVREWAAGNSTIGAFADVIYTTMVNLPRDEANSSYNFLSSHDVWRIGDIAMNKESIKAATLLNMTFVGAPVIYFGDEIGMDSNAYAWLSGQAAPNSFGSFNWNDSQWDYELLNYYKSLIQLRKTHGNVFTTGAFVELEVNEGENYYAFGRFNSDGSVAVVLNQNTEVITGVELAVNKLAVPDGTVLTDWLTGQKYTVKDGCVTVDVQPGGCALVKGEAGSYVGQYEKVSIGAGTASMEQTPDSIVLSGTSTFNGSKDQLLLAGQTIFSNGYVEASVEGGAILMLRASEAADASYYAAVVNGDAVEVWARLSSGQNAALVCKSAAGSKLAVAREDANLCVLYVDGKRVDASAVTISDFSYEILGGFAANGSGSVRQPVLDNNSANCAYADFSAGYGSVFYDNDKAVFADGLAVLDNTQLLSRGLYKDFSVRTLMASYTPKANGDFAGILIGKENLTSYISAGKTMIDGKQQIYAGIVTNGQLVIYGTVDWNSDGPVVLQLEKVGNFFCARVADTDLVFAQIPTGELVANYSDIVCGVNAVGSAKASFDWFAFGNADAQNYRGEFAGGTYGQIYLKKLYSNYDDYAQYRVGKGDWEYVENGWQAVSNNSMMYLTGKYKFFKTDVTLRFDNANAAATDYVEYVFGSKKSAAVSGNAASFRLYANGRFEILQNRTTLASGVVDDFAGEERFVFQCANNGLLAVYTGESPKVLAAVRLKNYTEGYHLFQANTRWSMLSPNVTNLAQNVSVLKGVADFNEGRIIMDATASTYAYASVVSQPLGDFIFSANMQLSLNNIYADGFAGIIIGSRVGAMPDEDGWFICINNDDQVVSDTELSNSIHLYHGSEKVASAKVDGLHYGSFYLIVAVQNGTIRIYVDPYAEKQVWSTEPVLTYDVGYSVGGSISFYAQQATVNYRSYQLYGLKPGEDYTTVPAFTERAVKKPIIKEPEVSEEEATKDVNYTFAGENGLKDWNRYSGNTELLVDNNDNYIGGLQIDGVGSWYSGAVNANGKYTNYRVTVTMKVVNRGSGWAGLLINKSNPTDHHEKSGILVYASAPAANGMAEVIVFDGSVIGRTGNAFTADSNGYITFTLQCVDGVLSLYNGNTELGSWSISKAPNRSGATKGYLSLVCGNNVAIFKKVTIEVLE